MSVRLSDDMMGGSLKAQDLTLVVNHGRMKDDGRRAGEFVMMSNSALA